MFADDMILNVENHKDSAKKKRINEFNKVTI